MADESFIVVHELTEDFDLEKELFEDEVDLMMCRELFHETRFKQDTR